MAKKNYIFIALTILVLTVLFRAIAQPYRISGDCMEPAVADGKLRFLNRVLPYIRHYQAGDIIAFTYEDKPWIARVIALEGDQIQIKEGHILVNDMTLQEGEIERNWADWDYGTYGINQILTVPKGSIFVLSDNLSAHHDDSRVFGPISNSSILGVLW